MKCVHKAVYVYAYTDIWYEYNQTAMMKVEKKVCMYVCICEENVEYIVSLCVNTM